MPPKDLFSGHSKQYATFRPTYPDQLYQFLFQHVPNKGRAWDCATGNGQVARHLSTCFQEVQATDISPQQIEQAFQATNIHYAVCTAEKTSFPDHSFDLITVGQALHWFDQAKFFDEVKRVGKPESILAVWGYALLFIDTPIDAIILDFYHNTVGPYWDVARRQVEAEYKTVAFPFSEITAPSFAIEVPWSLQHLTGYLESWSATQKYIKAKGSNPVAAVLQQLHSFWKKDELKLVRFPVFMRMGRVE